MHKSILKCIFVYLFLPFFLMAFTLPLLHQPIHAELIDRGGGMIYDTDLNITWLKDANYAKTSGYDADGFMTRSEAMTWAQNLVYGGYDDWRLPTTLQPDTSCGLQYNPGGGFPVQGYGYNCAQSEMGHLYYTELGNPAGGQLTNMGAFTNLLPQGYWSGTLYTPDTNRSWSFFFNNGYQLAHSDPYTYNLFAAWAVRDGDVISSSTDSTPPSPVPNFSAHPLSTSEIRLTWNVPYDKVGVFGYIIKKFQGTTYLDPDIIISGSNTSYKYTGLLTNTTYKFVIIAYDAADNRSEENVLFSSTLDEFTPPPPDNLTVTEKILETDPTDPVHISNLKYTQNALERYYNDRQQYPKALEELVPMYSRVLPKYSSQQNYFYAYYPTDTPKSYHLGAPLGGRNASDPEAFKSDADFNSKTAGFISGFTGMDPVYDLVGGVSPLPKPNLSATAVSLTQINLYWAISQDTIGSDTAGYRIYRDNVQIGVVDYTTTSYSDTGVFYGITYTYYVIAYDNAGKTSFRSNLVQVSTVDNQPPSNVAFTVSPVSSTRIDVSWAPATDNVGVVRYEVIKYSGTCCFPTYLGSVNVYHPTLSYSHTGLSPGSWYAYNVFAYDAAGNKSGSPSVIYAQTPLDSDPPSIPTGLSASAVSSSQINLSWTASTDNAGVAKYELYMYRGPCCSSSFLGTTTLSGSQTSFSHTGLDPNTTYGYYVIAYDAAGNQSGSTGIVYATTLPDTIHPTIPHNITTTAISATQVNFYWESSSDDVGVAGYYIKISSNGINFVEVANIPHTGAPSYQYSLMGLDPNTKYYYLIVAYDTTGNLSSNATMTSKSDVAYVSNQDGTKLSVIDLNTNNIIQTIDVYYPVCYPYSPPPGVLPQTNDIKVLNGKIFLGVPGGMDPGCGINQVKVVDVNSSSVVNTINTSQGPSGFKEYNGKLYVVNRYGNTIQEIDPATEGILRDIPYSNPIPGNMNGPISIEIVNDKVYLPLPGGGNGPGAILVLDLTTGVQLNLLSLIDFGMVDFYGPVSIRQVANNKIYVGSYGGVAVLDTVTDTIVKTMSARDLYWSYGFVSAFAVASNKVFTANSDSTVSVIDLLTDTFIRQIDVGFHPFVSHNVVDIAALGDKIYVTDPDDGYGYPQGIKIIDSLSDNLTGTIPVYEWPGVGAIDILEKVIQIEPPFITTPIALPSMNIMLNDFTTWLGDSRTVKALFKNTGNQNITISNVQIAGVDWLTPISALPTLAPGQEVELWFRLSVPTTATGGVYPSPQVYPAAIGVNTTEGYTFNNAFSINVFKESTSILNIQVLADSTGVPLPGAMVTLEGSATSYATDSSGRVQITTAPGIKNVYAYKDGYKPLALSASLLPLENNLTLRLHPGEVLVVDQVQVTPLTQQEIVNRGVQLTDPTNYWVYDFTVALAIDGTPTTINQTSVVLPTNPNPGTTTTLQSTTVQSSGGGTSTIQPTVIALPEGKRAYAFLIIPGEIKLLKEFFEAKVIVKNEADLGFVISGTTATLNIPSALVLVPLNGVAQQVAMPLGDIAGGSQAEARWILRGDEAGDHTIGVNASGVLQPFNLTLTASNSGLVKVYGKPNISTVFNVPSIMNAGEEFVFAITITNTSPIAVNGVSAGLDTGNFVNVHLASGESPLKDIGILSEAGIPGSTQTVEFRLVSEIDGIISALHSAVYSDPQLLASLTIISCTHGVGEGASNAELTTFGNAYKDGGGYTALGCPQGAVRPALASGAIGSTSTGLVQDFEKGHIHLISGDTTAHATTGAIETIYFDMGATASQLGFPISDLYITPEGYTGQGFEGGSMYTDFAGVTHTIFTAQPQLIKLSNDYHVYYVENGINRHIPDPETFELLRFDWNAITPVTSVGTPGSPVPVLRTGSAKDGSLVRRKAGGPGNTIKVYLIENGIARHVPDPDTLFAMGRRFNDVIELESTLFDRIPKGSEIPSVNSSAADDSFINFVSGFGLDAPAGFVAGVNTAIGNYAHHRTDLVIPGRGLSFALSSTYNAKDSYDHVMGPGWTHSYDMEAMETQKTPPGSTTPGNVFVSVKWGDGHEEFYQWDNTASSYKALNGVHNILSGGGGSNTLTVLTKSQIEYVFELLESVPNISQDKNGAGTVIITNRYRLKGISDRNGNAITLNYSGLLSSIADTVGRTINFTYTEMTDQSTGTIVTRLKTVTDPIGRTIEFSYDADGKITEIKDPSGGISKYSYKKDKVIGMPTPLIEEIRDPRGNPAVHNSYKEDIARPDYKKVDSIAIGGILHTISDDGNTTTVTDHVSYRKYTHDKNRLTSMVDPAGNIGIAYDALNFMNPNSIKDKMDGYTTYEYDSRGNVLTATDALSNNTMFEYDSRNNPTRKADALGRVTTYSYDAIGNLIRITAPVGTTDITYNYHGQPETVTDANGNVTTFIYDTQGNLTEARQPLGRTTIYGYDSVGRRISVTDANNNTTTFSYDNNNRLLTVTDPLGKTERYEYDKNGNKTAVIDKNGNSAGFTYDEKNRLIRTVDANGSATVYEYDSRNRMIRMTDADNKDTTFEYDAVGNLIKVIDANNGVVTYIYDANGNRLSMTDPDSHTTGYAYDALNRITKKTEPLGGQYRYVYDIAGNMTSMTDARGNTTQYSYDAMDRLSLITYIDSSTVSFNYDSNGNRTRMADSAGTTAYNYDALNRMINYTDPYDKSVGYGYDSNGNRLSTTYPDGKVVQYGYDNLNRLVSAADWLNRTTSYSYDSASRLTGTINPNSTAVSYSYDNASRLTGLINRKSNSTVISSYNYILDAVGNHTQSAQTEPLLPAMPDQNVPYTYDAENRLTSAGGVSFRFDANGNMEAKGGDNFSYDYRDKLIQSIIADKITQYQYNGAGDRLSKTEDGINKRYVMDINSDLPNIIAETDGNGNITAYYVYGLGLISKVLPDGAAFYYHYDNRGSTIALTDAGQNITDAYAYDPFGKVVNSTGSTPNPFRYVGRYGLMDEGNGLTYVRARYYAPELGRFITKDPLTGKAGDSQSLNRYIYAVNNPVGLVDVDGFAGQTSITQNTSNSTAYMLSEKDRSLLESNQAFMLEFMKDAINQVCSPREIQKYALIAESLGWALGLPGGSTVYLAACGGWLIGYHIVGPIIEEYIPGRKITFTRNEQGELIKTKEEYITKKQLLSVRKGEETMKRHYYNEDAFGSQGIDITKRPPERVRHYYNEDAFESSAY